MWNYERRLEYPVNITAPNAMLAQAIISQYGGPDGEMGASMRYLSQRYAAPYREVAAVLTDIGISVPKLRIMDFRYCSGKANLPELYDFSIISIEKISVWYSSFLPVELTLSFMPNGTHFSHTSTLLS